MIRNSTTMFVLGSAAVALVTAGIADARADQARPAAAPAPSCAVGDAAAPRTLADVFDRLRGSARADAVAGEVAAASALESQAASRPNPEIALELEDFAGSGSYSGFGESQTTLSVSQRIEVGGRRAQRMEVAARETGAEKARGSQETLRAEVAAKQAFVALIAARERRAISARGEVLAREVLGDARRRVEGGAGSVADVERASIAAATATLAVSEAERAVVVASQRLAGLWGGRGPDASCIAGELAHPRERAAPPEPAGDAGASPAVAIAEAEVAVRRAEVAKAKADSFPDLAVAAGVRHLAGPDDVSLVTGLNVEVPLFDRNAGNVRAAEQHLFAAQARARMVRDEAAGRLVRVREAVEAARERAAMLRTQAIPSAERAFTTLARAWRDGAASSLEVLDARRALIALRLEHVEALVEFHGSLASLEGSLGVVPARLEDTAPDAPPAPERAED